MKLYITPGGMTASRTKDFLQPARERFGFDQSIVITSCDCIIPLYNALKKDSVNILALNNPLFGQEEYMSTIRKVVCIIINMQPAPEEIIINSSGGTEKLSSIIKDLAVVLAAKFKVTRVFGMYDKTLRAPIFTEVPHIDPDKEMLLALDTVAKLKEVTNGCSVDIHKDQR